MNPETTGILCAPQNHKREQEVRSQKNSVLPSRQMAADQQLSTSPPHPRAVLRGLILLQMILHYFKAITHELL